MVKEGLLRKKERMGRAEDEEEKGVMVEEDWKREKEARGEREREVIEGKDVIA